MHPILALGSSVCNTFLAMVCKTCNANKDRDSQPLRPLLGLDDDDDDEDDVVPTGNTAKPLGAGSAAATTASAAATASAIFKGDQEVPLPLFESPLFETEDPFSKTVLQKEKEIFSLVKSVTSRK